MKLLRSIRFDASDTHVYALAASPNEWAVPGGFEFAGDPAVARTGKVRQAFANGFLGLTSFGRSTFATVSEIMPDELAHAERALARHFVDAYGAPGLSAALPEAQAEIGFAIDLCQDIPINTVLTLRRVVDDGGQIREEFRTINAPTGEPQHARIWTITDEA
jgi:Family of unknown function (DUF6505)